MNLAYSMITVLSAINGLALNRFCHCELLKC